MTAPASKLEERLRALIAQRCHPPASADCATCMGLFRAAAALGMEDALEDIRAVQIDWVAAGDGQHANAAEYLIGRIRARAAALRDGGGA